MPSAELCTAEEIVELVHRFYDGVRGDAVLGPVFQAHVKDWDTHLPKMVDFWSSALRGTARFRGGPLAQARRHCPGRASRLTVYRHFGL